LAYVNYRVAQLIYFALAEFPLIDSA